MSILNSIAQEIRTELTKLEALFRDNSTPVSAVQDQFDKLADKVTEAKSHVSEHAEGDDATIADVHSAEIDKLGGAEALVGGDTSANRFNNQAISYAASTANPDEAKARSGIGAMTDSTGSTAGQTDAPEGEATVAAGDGNVSVEGSDGDNTDLEPKTAKKSK